MMCWLPWLYGAAAVWLSVPGLLRNRQDVLDALKLLSGFLQKFGGIIDFTGSDLAEGHLCDGLCKSMDSSVFGGSWSLHFKGLSRPQVDV